MEVHLQKSTPPQIFFKTIQGYFRAAYPNQVLLLVTKNTVPKEFLIKENILDGVFCQQSCRLTTAAFGIRFNVKKIVLKPCGNSTSNFSKHSLRRSPNHFPRRSPRRSLRHPLGHFSNTFPVPGFPFFHSSIRVFIIAFYYLFTNVLFKIHYNKYMAYESKITGMGELFNANLSIWHVLN